MTTKTFALVLVIQDRDNKIDTMKLINVSKEKAELEKQIADIRADAERLSTEHTPLVQDKDFLKYRNEMWKNTITYRILEK